MEMARPFLARLAASNQYLFTDKEYIVGEPQNLNQGPVALCATYWPSVVSRLRPNSMFYDFERHVDGEEPQAGNVQSGPCVCSHCI